MSNQLFIYSQYNTNAIAFFLINSLYKEGTFIFVITPLSAVVTLVLIWLQRMFSTQNYWLKDIFM